LSNYDVARDARASFAVSIFPLNDLPTRLSREISRHPEFENCHTRGAWAG
jgi:hypothetical protein